MIGAIIGVIGALAGTILGFALYRHEERRRQKEQETEREKRLAALLMLFLDEFVEEFVRCVLYYGQRFRREGFSHSSLYQPTDSTTLAEFVKLCDDMSLHECVFRLKTTFYQVALNIPKLAEALQRSLSDQLPLDSEAGELGSAHPIGNTMRLIYRSELVRWAQLADGYQGAIVAFFLGQEGEAYPVVVESIKKLSDAARKSEWSDKTRLQTLEKRFKEAQEKKAEVDSLRRKAERAELSEKESEEGQG